MKSEAWEGPRRSKRMRSAAELDTAAKANRETLRNSTRNRDMVHSETEMWGPGKLLGEDSTGRSGWASYWWPGNVLNWGNAVADAQTGNGGLRAVVSHPSAIRLRKDGAPSV